MQPIKIKLWNEKYLPTMKNVGDACFDCKIRLDGRVNNIKMVYPNGSYVQNVQGLKSVELPPHYRGVFPLGFAMELPAFLEGQIRPRSGLAGDGIDAHYSTIDSNYRGEWHVILENTSSITFNIEDEMRLCQLAIREIPTAVKPNESFLKLQEFIRLDNGVEERGAFALAHIVKDLFVDLYDNDITFEEVENLKPTERGDNGFGSSGV